MYRSPSLILIAFLVAFSLPPAFASGNAEKTTPNAEAKTIVVSILPQAYFVQRIAGDRFKPVVLVGPGQSPHAYEPTPRQIAEVAGAAAWLRIGVDFEKALAPKLAATYPALRIVDTTVGVKYRQLEAHSHDGEETGDEEGGEDPHAWLGHQPVVAMSAVIRDTLSDLDPAGKAVYAANYEAFVAEVDAVFKELKPKLAGLAGKPIFVFHPAFGYFLDEFGLEQEAVETGGKEPTQKHLARLIDEAKADGAKAIFVQAQFPVSAAKTVAEAIGGVVVPLDSLAPDWLDNLKRMGEALAKAAR